jgi:hypothetical protein
VFGLLSKNSGRSLELRVYAVSWALLCPTLRGNRLKAELRAPACRLVDTPVLICSYHGVKYFAALLLISAFVFSSCSTLSNRRDLYRQDKANGPWTQKLHKM